MESKNLIHHFDFSQGTEKTTENYLPEEGPVRILITSGASCPDAMVERILEKLASYYNVSLPYGEWELNG
jgi:4-hydroxy-3-methylbut-2-enyl diphosphate reductase